MTEHERALLHELHALKKDPYGKRIIHFCVSMVPRAPDHGKRMDIAQSLVRRALAKSPQTNVFPVGSGDLFATYSHVSISEVLGLCRKIENIFLGEEVLTLRNPYGEYAFYKVADATKELDTIFSVVKDQISRRQPEDNPADKEPMTPDKLILLTERIKSVDLRHCIFNQPIYYIGDKVPSIEFLEFYISIKQLESNFMPGVHLTGNPWLFHAMREEFDRATLRTVVHELGEYRHKAFSVNVALSTILSQEFLDFYTALPSKLAGKIVLEFHKTDLLQHLHLIQDVQSFAREKGLRLCVDGVRWQDFSLLSMRHIQADFIKVGWSQEIPSTQPADLKPFLNGIKELGPRSQLIVTYCEDPRAFLFARALGAKYVQGRLADQYFKSGLSFDAGAVGEAVRSPVALAGVDA